MERGSIFEANDIYDADHDRPVAATVRGKLKLSVSGHMALRVLKGETNCCNELGHVLRYIPRVSPVSSLRMVQYTKYTKARVA